MRLRVPAIALLLAGGLALAESGHERSLAIYPPQKLPVRFDHAQHLKAGAECVTCHDPARKSVRASDLNLPKHPECEDCHDIKGAAEGKEVDPPAACEDCHPGFDHTVQKEPSRIELPAPNLLFNHKVHVDRKVDCQVCHGQMGNVQLATRMQLPKMATCLTCHDGRQASGECKTCHLRQSSGRLQLSFASGALRPMQGDPLGMDHGSRFEFTHGTRATVGRQTCMQCHAESYCQTCHDSLQKPLSVHPNDFITLHPAQARANVTRCESCHRLQSFCTACHDRAGVGLEADRSLLARNAAVHPPWNLWVGEINPQHHAFPASRDIKQCIACHREETCIRCHSEEAKGSKWVGATGSPNPHPEDFLGRCRALVAANPRPCLKCHVEATCR